MAQTKLWLSQRAEMAEKLSFLRRLAAAVKGTAEYWKNYPISAFADYNVAMKKKKEFARQIFSQASIPNLQAYAEYLLNQYSFDSGAGPDLDENGELSDTVISDSAASAATFDYFAGVKTGDETKQIEL